MPKLTIDGIETEVPVGTNLIEAAATVGIHIPHFCYHPALKIVGQCRMCLVEVQPGPPKLQAACSTTVGPKDGMEVKTNTEKVQKARKAIMEFLLINHPLDCPECDQAGECSLQDYSFEYGQGFSRYKEEKRTYPREVKVGDKLVRIMDRCIHCTRCVRFFRDIVGEEIMLPEYRGNATNITPLVENNQGNLDTGYSGNMHELCPCGALTSKDFRFRTRPWNLTPTETVCPLCSTGCNIYVDLKQSDVYRIRPRVNMDVNTWWICDQGRYEYKYINGDDRIAAPEINGAAADWDQALDAAAKALKAAPDAIAGLCSASITNEEAFLINTLLTQAIGAGALDCKLTDDAVDPSEMEDKLLRRVDKNANTRGVRALLSGGVKGAALAKKIASGEVKTLVLLNPANKNIASQLENIDLSKVNTLIVIDFLKTALAAKNTIVLPSCSFIEKSGTFTNHAGKVQRITPAIAPLGKARTDSDILCALADRLGADWAWKSDIDVYNEIKETLLKLEPEITKELEEKKKKAEEEAKAAEAAEES